MKIKSKLLEAENLNRTLKRLAHEIIEHNHGTETLAVVGIRTRGEFLARRITNIIQSIENKILPIGVLDITLYRDDIRQRMESPVLKGTEIQFDVTNRDIVLVDDVLYTGRTVRAAMDELMDLGRPKTIQLAVLIDRGHRELPIRADYVGKNVPTSENEQIQVLLKEIDGEDAVFVIRKEN